MEYSKHRLRLRLSDRISETARKKGNIPRSFSTDVLEWGQECSNSKSANDFNDSDTNDMLNIMERKKL